LTSQPAFVGSASWFPGNPTTAGMHTATVAFTAVTPGTCHYLCPRPRPCPERHDRGPRRQPSWL